MNEIKPLSNQHTQLGKKENLNNKIFKIEYRINLTPKSFDYFGKFCEILNLSQYEFIDNLLEMYVKEILSGINKKDYDLIVKYSDLQSMLEDNNKKINNSDGEEINHKITIKIRKKLDNTIKEICNIIKKVEPQKFIENTVEYKIKALIIDIEEEEYGFLEDLKIISERLKKLKELKFDH